MSYSFFSKLYIRSFDFFGKWKSNGSSFSAFKYKVATRLCRSYFKKKFPEYAEKHPVYGLNTDITRNEKIIVSLTSFPARIDKVWIAISTIMRQSFKPDAIELWLSEDQFPNREADLPEKLLNLKKYGLSVCFCKGDLRSHKKYFYAMQKHPDDIVITCDDDLFYPADTLEQLLKMHSESNDCVIGISNTLFDSSDFFNPISWDMQKSPTKDKINLGICGGSATLFPPNSLAKQAFDEDLIEKICPYADDQWLTAMIYLNGKTVSSVGRIPFPISIEGTQEVTLYDKNNSVTSAINNDTQWNAILNEFSDELKCWKEKILNE